IRGSSERPRSPRRRRGPGVSGPAAPPPASNPPPPLAPASLPSDSRTKTAAPAFLVGAGAPSILASGAPTCSTVSKAPRGRASVGWLDRFPGRKSASDPQVLVKVLPPDQVEAGGAKPAQSGARVSLHPT